MIHPLGAWCLCTLVLSMVMVAPASGQDSAALATDAIFARKIMMSGIADNLTEISKMLESKAPLDLEDARFHADMISILLMGFPHLFPASTNQWQPGVERDPGTDTFAAPEIWTRYADFYEKAGTASKTAYRASRAEREAEFRNAIGELEAACNGCHALYQKTE